EVRKTKKQEEWNTTLKRLKGVGSGMATIGKGISILSTPVSADDPEVKTLAASLLECDKQKKQEFSELLAEFSDLASKQKDAMVKLTGAQQDIDLHISNIAQNLADLNALSHQRQTHANRLNVKLKRYLREMIRRSTDARNYSLYTFRMAYRYEFLV